MAWKRKDDSASMPTHRVLTPPRVFLLRMAVFLVLVGMIAAILSPMLISSFKANPALNGLIVAVFAVGIVYAFVQVIRLYPEIRWVNAFRIADPGLAADHQPILLSPMATMLRDRTGALSLSTNAMRTIMDSISSRLDDARDTGRYLVGLLVFLGLLGTFWGLLETMQAVGKTIAALDNKGSDAVDAFNNLKEGLSAPLKGMGTAFSSSLLGLAGSLVLGFLELQAGQAHNRFYNELEEWLSGITELTPGSSGNNEQLGRTLYNAVYEIQRSVMDLTTQLQATLPQAIRANPDQSVKDLTLGLNALINRLQEEQGIMRQWMDDQAGHSANQQAEVHRLVKIVAARIGADLGQPTAPAGARVVPGPAPVRPAPVPAGAHRESRTDDTTVISPGITPKRS
jgi:MotA/TolQ/ExbB proton channel family